MVAVVVLCYGCCFCVYIYVYIYKIVYVYGKTKGAKSRNWSHLHIFPWLAKETHLAFPYPLLDRQHMSWNKFYVHLLTSANNEHPLMFVTWLSPKLGSVSWLWTEFLVSLCLSRNSFLSPTVRVPLHIVLVWLFALPQVQRFKFQCFERGQQHKIVLNFTKNT